MIRVTGAKHAVSGSSFFATLTWFGGHICTLWGVVGWLPLAAVQIPARLWSARD
jgi:hypothetical protein